MNAPMLVPAVNIRRVFALTSLAAVLLSGQAMAATEAPPAFVKRISDTLVARLKAERATIKKDPNALNRVVQENIEPYVDFEGFAKGVMGPYYRQANDAQRQAFTQTFKQSLVRTYAKGLAAYNNESYTIRPYTAGKDSSKAVVSMDFKTDTGTVVPITYQLIDINNAWKVRNLQLNGIDIGLTFRNQFASTVQNQHGNLDAAIKSFVPTADAVAK